MSPRIIATAFHCTKSPDDDGNKPCDHSNGARLAIIGQHSVDPFNMDSYPTIPIIEARAPPNAGPISDEASVESHDFAIAILQKPVEWSDKVRPICLPPQGEEHGGKKAIAAGWGRTAAPEVSESQSSVLKVRLKLSSIFMKISQ